MFETFSYLPPLSDAEIARQVDYITGNGWTPCLEFAGPNEAYTSSVNTVRMGAVTANYFDNRYWTMWKLPMFGCSDPGQVLREVAACRKVRMMNRGYHLLNIHQFYPQSFPDAYIRMVAFDSVRQVQITSFLVHRPSSARDWRLPNQRQV